MKIPSLSKAKEKKERQKERQAEEQREIKTSKVKKKQGITFASWNTRGKRDERHQNKWKTIQRIMNLQRIAILAVQELRTTNDDIKNLENKHPGLKFLNNRNYANKQGVLFAINERVIEIKKGELEKNYKVLIPN